MNDSLSAAESTFISNSGDSKLARACVAYATAWNRLDVSIIECHLAEEIRYGSQEKLDELSGKAEVLDYITAKIETIREGGLACRIRAELALDPLNGRPCVLVYQRRNKYEAGFGKPVAYVELELDGKGRFLRIFAVSLIPSPNSCSRTGLFPGLTTDQLARDGNAPRLLLSPEASLTLKLFVMSVPGPWTTMQRAVSSLCEKHPSWRCITISVELTVPDVPTEATGEMHRYGVFGFPTLIVEHDGEECCRIEGIQTASEIEARVGKLSNAGHTS